MIYFKFLLVLNILLICSCATSKPAKQKVMSMIDVYAKASGQAQEDLAKFVEKNLKQQKTFGYVKPYIPVINEPIVKKVWIPDQKSEDNSDVLIAGHQVFSTLHTNRALDALLRLNDLGLPFTHLADHLSMIISQRLIRKLCLNCKKQEKINGEYVYTPVGCNACNKGYKGQTIIAEILPIDQTICDHIAAGDIVSIRKILVKNNNSTMQDDAKRLVAAGLTSLQEVERILG